MQLLNQFCNFAVNRFLNLITGTIISRKIKLGLMYEFSKSHYTFVQFTGECGLYPKSLIYSTYFRANPENYGFRGHNSFEADPIEMQQGGDRFNIFEPSL